MSIQRIHSNSSNFDLISVIDRATQKENSKEDESDEKHF
jgi:hypothetical protein